MEESYEVVRQAPCYWFVVCFMPNLSAGCCQEAAMRVWKGLLKRGSGIHAGLLLPVVISLFPCSCMACCLRSSIPVASDRKEDALGLQSLLVNRKSGGFSSGGCCPSPKLQNLCCISIVVCFSWKNSDLDLVMTCSLYLCSHDAWINFGSCMWDFKGLMVLISFFHGIITVQCSFVIDTLKLGSKGIKCILNSKCFFCTLEKRTIDDLAKDGGSCLLGSIHRWQMREPLMLISRYVKRESFRLSSVMRLRNLHLIHLLLLVLDCQKSR